MNQCSPGAYVVSVNMRVNILATYMFVHNRKIHVAIFSNGCMAVMIDFIRYLYAFSIKSYFLKKKKIIFILLAVS